MKGEESGDCEKFAKYYRSLCPGEWVSGPWHVALFKFCVNIRVDNTFETDAI